MVIVSDREFGIRLVSGSISGMRMIDLGNEPYTYYHYLHKKNAELIPRIEAILLQMKESGRIDEILGKNP